MISSISMKKVMSAFQDCSYFKSMALFVRPEKVYYSCSGPCYNILYYPLPFTEACPVIGSNACYQRIKHMTCLHLSAIGSTVPIPCNDILNP